MLSTDMNIDEGARDMGKGKVLDWLEREQGNLLRRLGTVLLEVFRR